MNIEYVSKIENIKIPNRKVFYIIDKNCYNLNKSKLSFIPEESSFIFSSKEKNKSLFMYKKIISKILRKGLTKKDCIIGIGGGIVCDITTFITGTYKRGIDHILIPTTLIAMIDASIGGKGGVNHRKYKNQIGVIKEPIQNIICTEFLETLPNSERTSAYGEIIKYAFISKTIHDEITPNLEIDLNFIKKCIECKSQYVEKDLYEVDIRKILNLGHTIGHAIEAYTRHKVSHGTAVAYGIRYIVERKFKLNEISESQYNEYLKIFKYFNIPKYDINPIKMYKYIAQDKKAIDKETTEYIDIVDIGKCEIKQIKIKDLLCIK